MSDLWVRLRSPSFHYLERVPWEAGQGRHMGQVWNAAPRMESWILAKNEGFAVEVKALVLVLILFLGSEKTGSHDLSTSVSLYLHL